MDEDTGAKKYWYIRTGADHFSLAFTYAWMAATVDAGLWAWLMSLKDREPGESRDDPVFTASFFSDSRTHDGRDIKPPSWPSRFW